MMNFIFKQLSKHYFAIAYSILIVYLCAKPSPDLPDGMNDKMAHFLAFSGIGFLYFFLSEKKWLLILLGMLFGVAIEIMQWLLPASFNRGFDVWDMVYDAIGVFIGALIALGFQFLARKI